jgi:hypothetical protein
MVRGESCSTGETRVHISSYGRLHYMQLCRLVLHSMCRGEWRTKAAASQMVDIHPSSSHPILLPEPLFPVTRRF